MRQAAQDVNLHQRACCGLWAPWTLAAFALHKSGTATLLQALLPAALGYCLRALICGLQLTRELDDAKAALDKADAEVTGLQAALESIRARHFEQLSR